MDLQAQEKHYWQLRSLSFLSNILSYLRALGLPNQRVSSFMDLLQAQDKHYWHVQLLITLTVSSSEDLVLNWFKSILVRVSGWFMNSLLWLGNMHHPLYSWMK